MFTQADVKQINDRGIRVAEAERQLAMFEKGVAVPELIEPCTLNNGVEPLEPEDIKGLTPLFQEAVEQKRTTRFVPASGAATRMFKELAAFLHQKEDAPTASVESFINNIRRFAFYDDLARAAGRNGQDLENLIAENRCRQILELLLYFPGLGFARLPKGLIPFHCYENACYTAFEEHLAETMELIGESNGPARLHFTVAPDHLEAIKKLVNDAMEKGKFPGGKDRFTVDYSLQGSATDTIAANADNAPLRDKDGRLVFRPGGHGALLSNLNRIEADLVMIKNIDNVAAAPVRQTTTPALKALTGLLVERQRRVFDYLRILAEKEPDETRLDEMLDFARRKLNIFVPENMAGQTDRSTVDFLIDALNRPLRVCGVVRHEGEPGGGPFKVKDSRGNRSLQIIEADQVDTNDPSQKKIWESSTHFNPVIMACGLKDYQGRPFDLTRFADSAAGIITEKSQDGRPLKALEHPGLWNGAMAFWNTIFVELPRDAFNPVKTVFDLLRPNHQTM